jgi:hypothetical protein
VRHPGRWGSAWGPDGLPRRGVVASTRAFKRGPSLPPQRRARYNALYVKEIGVNPRDYLYDVLRRLSKCSDVAKLTPHGWKANFQEEVAAKRDELLALFLDST